MLIDSYEIEMFSPPCDPGSPIWVARVKTNTDLGEPLPYINACVRNAFYDPKTPTLVWREDAHKYALRQNVISINNLKDRDHAERVAKKIVDRINEIWEKRGDMAPSYTSQVVPKLLDILKLLPRTNCKECGYPSCMAFAAQIVEGDRCAEDCPPLNNEDWRGNLEKLRNMGL